MHARGVRTGDALRESQLSYALDSRASAYEHMSEHPSVWQVTI